MKRRLLTVTSVCLAFAFGLWLLAEDTLRRVVASNASAVSANWAVNLAHNIPELSELLISGRQIDQSLIAMRPTQTDDGVYRFRVFDRNGGLKFDSQPDSADAIGDPDIQGDNTAIAARVANRGIREQRDVWRVVDDQSRYHVITMLPFDVADIKLGAVEVHVDVTDYVNLLRHELQQTTFILIVVSTFGCWVPLAAYAWRAHQSDCMAQELETAETIDALTELPNRKALLSTLARLIQAPADDLEAVTLDLVNLDQFKAVNERHGSEAGDAILKDIGQSLRQNCPADADVFRIGGDEFAILTPLNGRVELSPSVFQQCVELPRTVEGTDETVMLRCSIGTARWPAHGRTANDLLANAETARFIAKLNGKNRQVTYSPDLKARRNEAMELEAHVQFAVERKRFELHFQPYFANAGKTLVGFEALLRLTTDDGQPVSPARFIPILEETGLINTVGSWVLNESCRMAANWPDHLKISVNISHVQFADGHLADIVTKALADSGMSAEKLEIEITESLMAHDYASEREQLEAIRDMGVSVAIDDFGAGYSSLGQLWRFPIDKLKLDRSFITELESGSGKALEVVKSVVGLGRSLNMAVTVEGVETREQARILHALDVEYQQGFLHGRPAPRAEAEARILRAMADQAKRPGQKRAVRKRRGSGSKVA